MLPEFPFDGDDDAVSAWCIELAKRVEFWQTKLHLLGIGSFRIDGVSLVEHPKGRSNAVAAVWVSESYDSCSFEFHNERFVELSPEHMDEVIVHEWLHVVFRDMTQAIALVDDHLSNPIQEMWDEAVTHAEEGLIDRLARQFVVESSLDV